MLGSLAQKPIPCGLPARHRRTRVCRPSISLLSRGKPMLCATCSTKGRMLRSSTLTATSRSISLVSALLRAEARPRLRERLQLLRSLLRPEWELVVAGQVETPQQVRQTWPRSANFFGTQFPANSQTLSRLSHPAHQIRQTWNTLYRSFD